MKKEHERNMSLTVKGSIPELDDTIKFTILKNDVKKPAEIVCIDILNPDQESQAGISLDRKTAIEALELILKELKQELHENWLPISTIPQRLKNRKTMVSLKNTEREAICFYDQDDHEWYEPIAPGYRMFHPDFYKELL